MIEWPLESDLMQENLLKALHNRRWWSREGEFVYKFQDAFKEFIGVEYCFACTNGSQAIKIALKSLDIGFLDYIIVPSITFIATALSVLDVGAIPVFADVDIHTSCIDINSIKKLKNKYGEKVKAIIPVHIGGQCCDIKKICDFAKQENLYVIEDCAQAIGTACQEQYVGSFGDIGCFSFQNSKNITSGEGGALVTNNKNFAVKISKYSDYNRDLPGEVNDFKYLAGNYRMSEFQAAVLLAQLEEFPKQNELRERNYRFLTDAFSKIEGISVIDIPDCLTKHGCHFFMFRYHREKFGNRSKKEFISYLNSCGTPSWGGYEDMPLNNFPYFKNKIYLKEDPFWKQIYKMHPFMISEDDECKNAEILSEEFVWIPQFVLLRHRDEIKKIISAVNGFAK